VNADEKKAKSVIAHDDIVDGLFDTIKNELITMIHENPDDGEQACDLLMVAKYLERIGDHATNISEWVHFSITGEHVVQNRSCLITRIPPQLFSQRYSVLIRVGAKLYIQQKKLDAVRICQSQSIIITGGLQTFYVGEAFFYYLCQTI
jgi:hypothetical protein